MNITDILAQAGGLESISRELGVDQSQVAQGAAALAPAILGGFKKQAQTRTGGLEGLGSLLGQLGGTGLLDNVLAAQPTDVAQGNQVLGQIFGSKDVSRAVAANASAQTGLDAGLLKKMLPMLAMLVSGYLSQHQPQPPQRQAPAAGGLGGLLGGLLGGKASAATGGGGLGPLGSLLDMDGDGNPLDDILGMASKLGR